MKRWLLATLLLTYTIILSSPPEVVFPKEPPISDEQCLAWVIHDEARGESLRGARAVLDVVLVRMEQRKQTACDAVKEPSQFSGYRAGVFKQVDEAMLTRLKKVSKMSPEVSNCPYFHATYVSPVWRWKMQRCKQIGKHIFYKPIKEKTHGKQPSNRR